MGKRIRALAGCGMALVLLSGCGLGDDVAEKTVDPNASNAKTLDVRVKDYWTQLSEGNAVRAYDFLSERCQVERKEDFESKGAGRKVVASYEQRQINKMAYLRKSTDELVDSLDVKIRKIGSGNETATVSMDSSYEGISIPDTRWTRSIADNIWYLDSCRPPFKSQKEDLASWHLERERDQRAYREGLVRGNGQVPATPKNDSGDGY